MNLFGLKQRKAVITDRATKEIDASIDLLDRKCWLGPDWVHSVDLDKLNLNSPYNCVVAQIYGTFSYGVASLGVDYVSAVASGFRQRKGKELKLYTKLWHNKLVELKHERSQASVA